MEKIMMNVKKAASWIWKEMPVLIMLLFCVRPLIAAGIFTWIGYTISTPALAENFKLIESKNTFFWCAIIIMIYMLLRMWLFARKDEVKELKGAELLCIIKEYFKKHIWQLFFLLLVIWCVISAFCSEDWDTAFRGYYVSYMGLFSILAFAAVFLCMCFLVRQEEKKILILKVFFIVADILAVLMILQNFEVDFAVKAGFYHASASFRNSNYMGYYLNLAYIGCSTLYLYETNRKHKVFELASMILLAYALIENNTMGAILASMITSLVVIWFYSVNKPEERKTGKKFLPALILVIVITMSCLGILPSSNGNIMLNNFLSLGSDVETIVKDEDTDAIGSERGVLWKYFISVIPDHPLVGVGPDRIDERWTEYVTNAKPHNEYIEYALLLGIPGLFFYLAAMITLAINKYKYIKDQSPTVIIAACMIVAYMISAFFGVVTYYVTCYLFMLVGMMAYKEK